MYPQPPVPPFLFLLYYMLSSIDCSSVNCTILKNTLWLLFDLPCHYIIIVASWLLAVKHHHLASITWWGKGDTIGFLQMCRLSFYFVYSFFAIQRFLSLHFPQIFFVYISFTLGDSSKKHFYNLCQSIMFSSRSFIISGLIYLILFEFIFVWSVREYSNFIVTCSCPVFPAPVIEAVFTVYSCLLCYRFSAVQLSLSHVQLFVTP